MQKVVTKCAISLNSLPANMKVLGFVGLYPHLHLYSAKPWRGLLSAPCHNTQSLSQPCTYIVHLPVLCIVHLTCDFRHRLKLKCEMYDFLVLWEGLPQCALNSGSSLISVSENLSMSSITLLFLLRVVMFCTSFFIHSVYLIGLVIQFLPNVFVAHRS